MVWEVDNKVNMKLKMTEKIAYNLISSYVQGWKEDNIALITQPLSSDCLIIESHGPTYKGIRTIRKWVKVWIASGNKVTKWDINSFYFTGRAAIFEWVFKCIVKSKFYHIDGITIVVFKNNRIKYLHEYRMTKPAYKWGELEIVGD